MLSIVLSLQENWTLRKRISILVSILVLIQIVILLPCIPFVNADSAVSLTSVSTYSGVAGDSVTLEGTIGTSNGQYQILLNDTLLLTDTSVGYDVECVFTVPEVPSGNYLLILKDVTLDTNISTSFTVGINYSVEPILPSSPALLQEGSTVNLNVTITGGDSSTSYDANITVYLPDSIANYSQIVPLTTNENGTANDIMAFSNDTSYVGTHTVFFNLTDSSYLAYSTFTIGLTDLSEYHRNDLVTIYAVGYQANEAATLTISCTESNTTVLSRNIIASSSGVFSETWTVPSNALISEYTVKITPQYTNKTLNDTQLFNVPGYTIEVRTLNLAGQLVPSLAIEALDQATSTTYNATTGSYGNTSLNLEVGTHTITVYYLGVQVGQITQSISGDATYDITCQLANINVTVKNTDGFLLRNVDLTLFFQYVSSKDSLTYNSTITGQTDKSGNYVFNSTLTGISYTLNASVYGSTFNVGNNTISNLPAVATYQVTIICPTQNLTLTILDSNNSPIANARLTLIELTNGLFQNTTTNDAGAANLQLTFGKYELRVYSGNILLNSTSVDVFGDSQETIQCSRYGIQVTVKVVDFFGQPISNANVTLFTIGNANLSYMTDSTGLAVFDNLIGGDMEIVAYTSGMENNYQAISLTIDGTTTVLVRMGQFISLGPFLVGTNAFAVVMFTVVSLLMLLLLIVFQRKKWFSAIKTKMLK